MSASQLQKPRVCIYIPIDTSGESHRHIEELGCELVLGDTSWRTGIDRDALVEIATGAHALMGACLGLVLVWWLAVFRAGSDVHSGSTSAAAQ